MRYPKILLTGGTGQVGGELRNALIPLGIVCAPNREELDLEDLRALRLMVQNFKPDLIVNPAAYTAVDQAESEPELAQAINVEVPRVLAEEANKLGIPVIHYSTDYVFDGSKCEPYTEEDLTNPINVYGQTKLEGEAAIQDAHDQYLILRTSWVYSPERGKNFYRTMLELFKQREEIQVVDDQFGAPTSTLFLAEKTFNILSQVKSKEEGEKRWGTYHLTQEDNMSWYEFARNILEEAKKQPCDLKIKSVQPISSNQLNLIAKRPRNSQLNCSKIFGNFLL